MIKLLSWSEGIGTGPVGDSDRCEKIIVYLTPYNIPNSNRHNHQPDPYPMKD